MSTYTKTYAITTPSIQISTDAKFRDQGLFISDSLEAGGIVKQSSAGTQIDWTTVTYPTGSLTSKGYEIRATTDSFTPIYFKIEYGSGYNTNMLGLWVQMGTGYDSTGALTGILTSRMPVAGANGYGGTLAGRIFVSATTGRWTIAQVQDASNYDYALACGFQRETDASGVDIEGDAVCYGMWNFNSSWGQPASSLQTGEMIINASKKIVCADTKTPPSILRVKSVKRDSSNNPVFQGWCNGTSRPWPLRDWVCTRHAEITWNTAWSTTILGSSRTYIPCYGNTTTAAYWGYTAPEAFTWSHRYE